MGLVWRYVRPLTDQHALVMVALFAFNNRPSKQRQRKDNPIKFDLRAARVELAKLCKLLVENRRVLEPYWLGRGPEVAGRPVLPVAPIGYVDVLKQLLFLSEALRRAQDFMIAGASLFSPPIQPTRKHRQPVADIRHVVLKLDEAIRRNLITPRWRRDEVIAKTTNAILGLKAAYQINAGVVHQIRSTARRTARRRVSEHR